MYMPSAFPYIYYINIFILFFSCKILYNIGFFSKEVVKAKRVWLTEWMFFCCQKKTQKVISFRKKLLKISVIFNKQDKSRFKMQSSKWKSLINQGFPMTHFEQQFFFAFFTTPICLHKWDTYFNLLNKKRITQTTRVRIILIWRSRAKVKRYFHR